MSQAQPQLTSHVDYRRRRSRAEIESDPKNEFALPQSVFHLAALPLDASQREPSQALPPSSQSNSPWLSLVDVQVRYERLQHRRVYNRTRRSTKWPRTMPLPTVDDTAAVRLDEHTALDRQQTEIIGEHHFLA